MLTQVDPNLQVVNIWNWKKDIKTKKKLVWICPGGGGVMCTVGLSNLQTIVKVLLFVDANFLICLKVFGLWVFNFVVSYLSRHNSIEILYFVGHKILWFRWTTKSTKIGTILILILSQYNLVKNDNLMLNQLL